MRRRNAETKPEKLAKVLQIHWIWPFLLLSFSLRRVRRGRNLLLSDRFLLAESFLVVKYKMCQTKERLQSAFRRQARIPCGHRKSLVRRARRHAYASSAWMRDRMLSSRPRTSRAGTVAAKKNVYALRSDRVTPVAPERSFAVAGGLAASQRAVSE